MIKQLDKWHKTKLGLLVFVIVGLAISYGFACLAISHGNLWWYLSGLSFLAGSLRNLSKLTGKIFHAPKH
jgi:hypothetical protein